MKKQNAINKLMQLKEGLKCEHQFFNDLASYVLCYKADGFYHNNLKHEVALNTYEFYNYPPSITCEVIGFKDITFASFHLGGDLRYNYSGYFAFDMHYSDFLSLLEDYEGLHIEIDGNDYYVGFDPYGCLSYDFGGGVFELIDREYFTIKSIENLGYFGIDNRGKIDFEFESELDFELDFEVLEDNNFFNYRYIDGVVYAESKRDSNFVAKMDASGFDLITWSDAPFYKKEDNLSLF